jgi:hypothetical protein
VCVCVRIISERDALFPAYAPQASSGTCSLHDLIFNLKKTA